MPDTNWRANHRSDYNQYMRDYRKKHAEKIRSYQRDYNLRNREKRRASNIKRKHGITIEEYDRFLTEPCGICGKESEVLDHCHASGKIRGGLCQHCNRGIGCFGDSIPTIEKAIQYLLEARDGN